MLRGRWGASLVSVLLVAIGSSVAQPSQSNPEKEVRALQHEWMDAMAQGDRAALERIIADTFTFVHATGAMETKKEYIDRAAGGAQLFQRTETEVVDERLRVMDAHTAIWTSRVVMRNKADHSETRLLSTNMYVKTNGRWQWVAGQSTRLPNRPAAAAVTADVLKSYVGQYEIGLGRNLVVSDENGTLKATVPGWRPAELVPKSESEFVWFNPEMNVYSELAFLKDASGKVTNSVFRREGVEVWKARRVR
jgi:ketosteroid isomerase-like protein